MDSQLLQYQQLPTTEASRRDLSFAHIPGILVHIASYLPGNEVACGLRLINKVAAEALGDRNTIHLSQPVPEFAFTARWSPPAAMRPLTVSKRQKLLKLTAASGSLDNLRIAIQAAGLPPFRELSEAAAAAGHVHLVQWLRQEGWPQVDDCILLVAAVSNGHVRFAEELTGKQLSDWPTHPHLVKAAARGCDLETLQRFFAARQKHLRRDLGPEEKGALVSDAAGSRTPDWREKVEWLEEAQSGGPRSEYACAAAAGCPDAVERLDWLRQRGYPVGRDCIGVAVRRGNTAAVQYLLDEAGLQCSALSLEVAVYDASMEGHLPVLQQLLLHKIGLVTSRERIPRLARDAATNGHLAVVSWLADTFGIEAIRLDDELFYAAAASGNVELMAWLREQQCPWWRGIEGAAKGGSTEALEWLVERGCPKQGDGLPYMAAAVNSDLITLRSLRRLSCPWDPPGGLFISCLIDECNL